MRSLSLIFFSALLASTASASMLGTTVTFSVVDGHANGTSSTGFSQGGLTIVDPGVEFQFATGTYFDFTDTTLEFHFSLTDWHSDVETFTWTDTTTGALAGLNLISNTFPSPNANSGAPTTPAVWTNDGTTLTLSCCNVNTTYPTTGFVATFATTATPEPASVALMTAGLTALWFRRRKKIAL